MGSTMMYCLNPNRTMDLERAFLTAIGRAETCKVEGGELRMNYPGGVPAFTAR